MGGTWGFELTEMAEWGVSRIFLGLKIGLKEKNSGITQVGKWWGPNIFF